jgi:hypothetical protein
MAPSVPEIMDTTLYTVMKYMKNMELRMAVEETDARTGQQMAQLLNYLMMLSCSLI